MIIGSGLIARAFEPFATQLDGACIYAAGVSNSSCVDPREFTREHLRVEKALHDTMPDSLFVYFSTCSVADPELQASAYVNHKRAMEGLARMRPRHLILRLPQLAGRTPNPHTLLNFLYARITRSERFQVWSGACRNIIDVDDVARIVLDLLQSEHACGETVNVANGTSFPVAAIVASMEYVLGRRAVFDTIDRGDSYPIDIRRIGAALQRCSIDFSPTYLRDVISKYYGPHA